MTILMWLDAHWTLLVASAALGVAVGTLVSVIRWRRQHRCVIVARDIVLVDRDTGRRVMQLLCEEGCILPADARGHSTDDDGR